VFKKYPRVLFRAIREVETGGCKKPSEAVGEAGELGPYQISPAYFVDAKEYVPELNGEYKDVRCPYYAELIMMAYWERYAPNDKLETLARIHNGGPDGLWKKSTDVYWSKVRDVISNIQPGMIYADFDLRYRDECD